MTGTVSRASTYEQRRRAPLHFEARAQNARFTAYLLSREAVTTAADEIGYRGTPSIATYEGFAREASIALELIVKAVIAQRLELGEGLAQTKKVPASHNVPALWATARLPNLAPGDFGRLVRARVYLMWAARYPAPNRDEDGNRDDMDLWEHAYECLPNSAMFRKPFSFAWDDVNRIYGIASDCFWELRNAE